MAENESLRNISSQSEDDKLALMRERWNTADEAGYRQRVRERDDKRFFLGKHWPDDIERWRTAHDLPCMVMNRVQGNVARVTNETRLTRPMIQVKPQDGMADPETAKIIQGIIRNAGVRSHSDDAYDSATTLATIAGRGYFQLYVERNPRTLYRELRWRRIRDTARVRLDPHAQEVDFSDQEYAFIEHPMSHREFGTKWPDFEPSISVFAHQEDTYGWVTPDTVRVCQYYYRELTKVVRVRLSDGRVFAKGEEPPNSIIVEEAEVEDWVVWNTFTNGHAILEEATFPAPWIPVIPVFGEELEVDGDTHYIGVTRNAKDAQRYYNLNVSVKASLINKSPKVPYMMAEGQQEGHEWMYEQANSDDLPYLLYKPTSYEGHLNPPPRREVFEPPIQALTQETLMAAQDIERTSRVPDTALGLRSNEQSGVAIDQRTQNAELSNSHFSRNEARAIEHAGRIAIEVIRNVYTEPQVVQILGDNDEPSQVRINERFEENGQEKLYDLTVGAYDVVTQAGPSYKTRRDEAVSKLLDILRFVPSLFEIGGDMLVSNMDAPFARDLAARIKKTIPAELLEGEEGTSEEQLQVQLRRAMTLLNNLDAQRMQLTEQNVALVEALRAAQAQLGDKTRDLDRKDRELDLKAEIQRGELEVKEDAQELKEDEFVADISRGMTNGIP